MAEIQWGPWSGVLQGSPTGFPAASTHSAWSLSASDLEMLQKASRILYSFSHHTMLSMLTDSALSDVCLVVEGIEVPSHKAVLAAWSRPFRAMFTLPMLESRHQCRVVIEDAEHKHLMVVLHYLYGGRIGLNDKNVMPVSALANRYEVLPLVAQCEGFMKKRLNPSSVCQQLLAAEEHRVPKAAAFALEFLAVHFDEVCHDSSRDFNSLGGDTVLRVLQHNGLTADEETVFLAVDGWAKGWRHRRAIRGARPNFEAVRPLSPAEAGPATTQMPGGASTTNRGPSSSRSSVQKTLSAGDFPAPKKAWQDAQDTDRQCCIGTGGGGGAMEHDRLERTKGIATRRSEKDGPSMAPLAVVATAAPTVSAPAVSAATVARAAAGAGAAARKAQQEQHAVGQGPLIAAASAAAASTATTTATAAAAAAAAANASTDDTTGLPSSPDFACFTTPTPTAAAGIGGRGCSGNVGQLLTMAVGEEAGKGEAGGTVRGLPQRRAGGPAEGTERRGRCARRELEPGASFPPSPPRLQRSVEDAKKGAAVVVARGSSAAADAVADPGTEASKTVEASEAVTSMPEEERDSVDGLLEEVRFPLISTSFLCQVVEKSLAMTGSRVAHKLLHEAYRFQAMTSADAVDVDEHFPGNHRVKPALAPAGVPVGRAPLCRRSWPSQAAHTAIIASVCLMSLTNGACSCPLLGMFGVAGAMHENEQYRGHERVLFGEEDGCVGTVDDFSSSLSEVHVVDNVKRKDEKYWLPGQPEEAYFCVRLDRVRRVTKVRFQNRYSEEFEVAVRRTLNEEWQVIVPRRCSGGHKDIQEINLTRKRVKARHVKISLRGRKRSCYNTSCYWTELLGF
ncbi:unnamed protein product [Pylaiella littoralis]